MEDVKEEVKEVAAPFRVSDYKLGMKASRIYEELFGVNNIVDDLVAMRNIYEIVAVAKKPSTVESYYDFRESDEFDDLIPQIPKIIEKLLKDVEPKKD